MSLDSTAQDFSSAATEYGERIQRAAAHLPEATCEMSRYLRQMATMHLDIWSQNNLGRDKTRPEPKYHSFDEFYLRTGRSFAGSKKLTAEQMTHLLAVSRVARCQFRMRECFSNAMQLALADPTERIKYVEGYANVNVGIPIHHGWAEIDGNVIDLTIRRSDRAPGHVTGTRRFRDRIIGELPENFAYWGTSFSRVACVAFMVSTGTWGCVLNDWKNDHPYLTGEREP
jgi:hypothetical protein